MKNYLIKNCEFDGKISNLYIQNGIYVCEEEFSKDLPYEEIDASGLCAVPALIDLHTHMREPGYTQKETIKTGLAAANAGGFGAIVCMPNTFPVADNPETLDFINERARDNEKTELLPCACISVNQKSEALCDFALLKEHGAAAFSDDGRPVQNAELMRRALAEAKKVGLPILSHSEEMALSAGGAINEGCVSKTLGIKGIPSCAEDVGTARDIILAGSVGAHIHIAHVSTKGSVEIIRAAKKLGIHVTAETCPHYFVLNEDAVCKYGVNAKMNPPLRTEEDRLAILEALCDGTLDCISTDHAPHTEEDKGEDLQKSAFGICGLETSFALSYTYLVKKNLLSLNELLLKMSHNPSNILGREKYEIKEGKNAHLMLFEKDKEYTVDKESFLSKGRNTPFDGFSLYGKVVHLI